jgi:hypothetical protein
MPSDCAPDWHRDPQMERNELVNNQNTPQPMAKNQSLSLRKRFFSMSGTPMAMRPTTMTTGDSENMKEKLNAIMLNGKVDMTKILQTIEQR